MAIGATSVTGEELKKFMSSRQLSQETLAKRLGMDQSNISRWAIGNWTPAPAFHIAVRHFIDCEPHELATTPKKTGRPLVDNAFDLTKAICPATVCKRGGRQMYGDRTAIKDHWAFGKMLPVSCDGTPANKHKRVTRALDLKGRLWNISKWPPRRKLAPHERDRVRLARAKMGNSTDENAFLGALQKCTRTRDGRSGCGGYLRSSGPESSTNTLRQKLYRFVCPNPQCEFHWEGRLFDSKGTEQQRNPVGMGHLGKRKSTVRVPPSARHCPVCNQELRFPRECSDMGGRHYDPPLVRLTCLNRDLDHKPDLREARGLPRGSRSGLTFYYDRKKGWINPDLKPLKKGSPAIRCPLHHIRMQVFRHNASRLNRVPKYIQKKLGPGLPIFRALCKYGDAEVWLPADWKDRPGVKVRLSKAEKN